MAAVELKIDGNAPIGAIMSVNFYNEPLWSTIREVMANAIDATIASDSSMLPELRVNYNGGRTITVRDYGSGLSEEDVYKIFGGLFTSTKRDDIEATGGFGLGSKSPFSIAKNQAFRVVSYFGGTAKLYNFWIDPTNLKAMAECVAVSPSEEPTGIRVEIDVDDRFYDYQIREAACRFAKRCLSTFKVYINDEEYTTRFNVPEEFELANTMKDRSEVTVAVGNMVYTLYDMDQFSSSFPKGVNYYISANKKQIDMAPQRETIPLTAKNIEFINGEIAAINGTIDSKTKFFLSHTGQDVTKNAFFIREGYLIDILPYEKNAHFAKWSDVNPKSQDRIIEIIKNDEFSSTGKKRVAGISAGFTGYVLSSDDFEYDVDPLAINEQKKAASPRKQNNGEPKEAGHDFSQEFHKRDSFVLGINTQKWISWNAIVDTSREQRILDTCETMVVRRSDCGVKPIQNWNSQAIQLGKKYLVRRCTDEFFDQYVKEHPESDLVAVLPRLAEEQKQKARIEKVQNAFNKSKDSYSTWAFWTRFTENEIKGVDKLKATFDSDTVTIDNVDRYEKALNDLHNSSIDSLYFSECENFDMFKRLYNSYDEERSEKMIKALIKGLSL